MCSEISKKVIKDSSNSDSYKVQIVWTNVLFMIFIHLTAILGYCRLVTGSAKLLSGFYFWFVAVLSSFGILAGAHRLWSHRSYKAKWQLRVILAVLQTIALQNDIYEWCRDHRVHHRYSETDADPHNANRGFFFSHMGWLLCRKHPQVISKGKHIDMSDLWSDPIVRFQKKYYYLLLLIFWLLIPISIPIYYFEESLFNSLVLNIYRYVFSLHHTWVVNSWAHMRGYKPYDKQINPRENHNVVYMSLGEGYHNYHHTFPYDYSASEYGWRDCFNPATAFIDFFAWIGWAYERKVVSKETLESRISRTGDLATKQNIVSTYYSLFDFILGITVLSWFVWSSVLLNFILNYSYN